MELRNQYTRLLSAPHLPRRGWWVAIGCLAMAVSAVQASPWWDQWPTFVQTSDVAKAKGSGANTVLAGVADDCGWGIWGQRLRTLEQGKPRADALHAAGLRVLSWFEGFGTPTCYVVQLKRDAAGAWIKADGTDVTRAFLNQWGWSHFDGTGEVRWVGLQNYFEDDDFARPYTRLHPRYGCPPATYPDGRPAVGYDGSPLDPRRARCFDATCSKNVLGQTFGADRDKPLITDVLRGERPAPAGDERNAPTIVPDPGFTPEQWAEKTRKTGALTHIGAEKDSACPIWLDYARAEVRLALDCGVDGLWIDNFSPWDSLNASPLHHAFGDWSVARFRDHLRAGFRPEQLAAMGVTDLASFDMRDWMQAKVRAWGGDPTDLKDKLWKDARWQAEPLWRAYLIAKRRLGSEALSGLYRVLKEEAAAAGKPDFLVQGNDIPAFSLGWPRGDLDMVSTELTWGWWLATGPRGLMAPPLGSYVPVYRLAREHARSRFVNAWMYAAKEAQGKPIVGDTLAYQALANHALPMPQFGTHTVGTDEHNAAFQRFVGQAAPIFGERRPVEEVGVYYSSSSQVVDLLPAFFRDHAHQRHSFSFFGWGTALSWLHVPWRAVPEWKLNADTLAGLRLLVVPSAEVFSTAEATVLADWLRAGGRVIVAGDCGSRQGEDGNFDPAAGGSTLAGLPASARLLRLADDPGYAFYLAKETRPALLAGLRDALGKAGAAPETMTLSAPDAPYTVGLTLYRDGERWFVDVNNTDLDLEADALRPTAGLTVDLRLPAELRGRHFAVRAVSPDQPPEVDAQPIGDGLRLKIGSVRLYASLVLTPDPPRAK